MFQFPEMWLYLVHCRSPRAGCGMEVATATKIRRKRRIPHRHLPAATALRSREQKSASCQLHRLQQRRGEGGGGSDTTSRESSRSAAGSTLFSRCTQVSQSLDGKCKTGNVVPKLITELNGAVSEENKTAAVTKIPINLMKQTDH